MPGKGVDALPGRIKSLLSKYQDHVVGNPEFKINDITRYLFNNKLLVCVWPSVVEFIGDLSIISNGKNLYFVGDNILAEPEFVKKYECEIKEYNINIYSDKYFVTSRLFKNFKLATKKFSDLSADNKTQSNNSHTLKFNVESYELV